MNHRAIYEKGKAVFNVRGRLQMTSSPRARGVCQKVNGDIEQGGGGKMTKVEVMSFVDGSYKCKQNRKSKYL